MPDAIRCFIAVKIPPRDPLGRILTRLENLGRSLAVVNADKLHITLKFLGNVELERIPQLSDVIAAVVSPRLAAIGTLRGLGVFPNIRRPSVVWAGLAGADVLTGIVRELEDRLQAIGFPSEERRYQPHLTLARVKARPPESLQELIERHATTVFGDVDVNRVELIRSELGPAGARHSVLSSFPLIPASEDG